MFNVFKVLNVEKNQFSQLLLKWIKLVFQVDQLY